MHTAWKIDMNNHYFFLLFWLFFYVSNAATTSKVRISDLGSVRKVGEPSCVPPLEKYVALIFTAI